MSTLFNSGSPKPDAMNRSGRSHSLRTRFFLGVGIIMLIFFSACAYIVYRQGLVLVESASLAKSQIVMAGVEANMNYVREVLRPKVYEALGEDAFLLEAMSTSFVSRSVMDRFNSSMPDYRYRRVAINARNPTFEARPDEVRMIKYFSSAPEKRDWHGIVKNGDDAQFMLYRPVYLTESCLRCHGPVENAPKALVDLYGSERGFNHKVGDLAGLISIGIPVDVALGEIKGKAVAVFMSTLLVGAILFVIVVSFFNRLVASDLKRVLNVFREELPEELASHDSSTAALADRGLGEVPGSLQWADELRAFEEVQARDEVDEIAMGAQVMAQRLRENRRQLKEYAENLEGMVAERTRELQESQERLREQVIARNRELQTLNGLAEFTTSAVTLEEVLPQVLQQTLSIIPAKGAGLYLLREGSGTLELHCHHNAPGLEPTVPIDLEKCLIVGDPDEDGSHSNLQQATCGHIGFSPGNGRIEDLSIPLCCRGRVLGVMSFTGIDFDKIGPELQALLSSIGRQVGIAVESLQNMGKLIHSKELLQSIFDSITDPVVLLSRDFRIQMVNKAFVDRYGMADSEALGRFCFETHEKDLCQHPDNCGAQQVITTRKPVVVDVKGESGEFFLMHFYPVFDEQGEVESIVRYVRDVTEQKQMEEHIQKTERLASLGQLAAGLAHEINNPLGVILTYTGLLKQQSTEGSEMMEDVQTIEKHALTCKRIVSDLLNFARGERSSKKLTSLNRAIEDAVQMMAHQFSRRGVAVHLDLDPELPFINLDIDKMKQVFINLLMNSGQAVENGGEIRVNTTFVEDKGHIEVGFWDNGKGIPADLLPKVFDPFFSTKATGEGTGLGLSVSYGIIKDHGGEIRASSVFGRWTRFTIMLPVNGRI